MMSPDRRGGRPGGSRGLADCCRVSLPTPAPVPRTARGRRTREALLEAGRRAFAGVEWSRTRVEDVCREAGVGHGTFYAYFPNKTAVLEALVVQHAPALHGLMDQPWASGPGSDPALDVRRVISGYVEVTLADRDVREAWAAARPSEPTLAALDHEVRRQFTARILSTLAGAAEGGLVRPGLDLEVTAVALAAMVEHTVDVALLGGGAPAAPAGRVVDGLTALWVGSVYAGAGHPPG